MPDHNVYTVTRDKNGHVLVLKNGERWADATAEMQATGLVVEGDHVAAVVPHIAAEPNYLLDIANFHERFGQTYNGPPRTLPADIAVFREKFLREELNEYIAAQNNADALDALVDLVYVALGTAYLAGWDFAEAWRRVHAANMAKIPPAPGELKIRKPEGWQPPDLSNLVP